MKKYFNTYFLTVLSFLLVLSNFSYAASMTLCAMDTEAINAESFSKTSHCCSMQSIEYLEPGISKIKPDCCTEKVSTFSNSNILSEIKLVSEVKINFHNISFTPQNDALTYNFISDKINQEKPPLPKTGIRILVSSLLI